MDMQEIECRIKDLEKRVNKFNCFELPGQPTGMHMGTSYLVQDLMKTVKDLKSVVDNMK